MKNRWRRLGIVVTAMTLVGSGVVVTMATATPTPTTTYYACLSVGGALYNVNTTAAPKCAGRDKVVTWNQTGPAGTPGTNGTNGTNGTSVTSSALPVGNANCPNGGSSFTVQSVTTYACNGTNGKDGTNGTTVNTCSSPPGPDLNFSACDLESVSWDGVDLAGTLLINVNLSFANLSNVNFTGANLSFANLSNVNFTGANLTNANLSNATVTNATWTLADLSGANLTNVNFAGANLSDANLSNANLSFADLQGATGLTAAHMAGATYFYTICPNGAVTGPTAGSSCLADLTP